MASSSRAAESSWRSLHRSTPDSQRRPSIDWCLELARIWNPPSNSYPAGITREHYAVGVSSEERRADVLGNCVALRDHIKQMPTDLESLEEVCGEEPTVRPGRRIALLAHIEQMQMRMEILAEYNEEWSVLEQGMH